MAKQMQKTSSSAARKSKLSAISERMTKAEIVRTLAEDSGLTRKDVNAVFDSLKVLIQRHMKKRGSGELTIPEVGIKIRRSRKAATKQRSIISPFNGEEIVVPAKPARNTVKVSALKALKETIL